MEDRIVSRETALLAREKGLPRFLDNASNLTGYNPKWENASYWHVHMSFPSDEEFLYAPTQSLLQKWLREKHNIIAYLVRYDDGIYPPRWSVYIYSDKIKTLDKSKHRYICGNDNYEDGLEIGLFEALKLIQNEKDNN